MTRLGVWAGLVLLGFWVSGLAAFLVGGFPLARHVVQAFLVTVLAWACRELYREYAKQLRYNYARSQAFAHWARQRRWKGLDV